MQKMIAGRNNSLVLIAAMAFVTIFIVFLLQFILPQKGNIDRESDTLVLVNKQYDLSSDYIPADLTVPEVNFVKEIGADEKKMKWIAATALENMFTAASSEGVELYCESGYRSYESQKEIYERTKKENGDAYASKYSALPGHSEHQTGLCMDITNINHIDDANDKALGESKEGIWLRDHAHLYGFILRYPQGRTDVTGYNYEPWHFRYVGIAAATEIFNKGLVLEEYLGQK